MHDITEGQANGRWQPSRKRPSSNALRVQLPLLPLGKMIAQLQELSRPRLLIPRVASLQDCNLTSAICNLQFAAIPGVWWRHAALRRRKLQVRLLPGMLWPNPKRLRGPAVNRDRVGSTPTGHLEFLIFDFRVKKSKLETDNASDARRVGHRSRKADAVGSSPTAGSCTTSALPLAHLLAANPVATLQ